MPRLTRTQKFAELRESLANDKESSLQTKDLSNYEDRLNSITELLTPQTPVQESFAAPEAKEEEKPVEVSVPEQPVIEETDPKYTWTDFEDTPIESLVENFRSDEFEQVEEIKQESGIWHKIQETPVIPVMPAEKEDEAPVVAMTEAVEEYTTASNVQAETPVETPVYEEPAIETPAVDETQYTTSYTQTEEPVVEAPVYETLLEEEAVQPVTEVNPKEEEILGLYRPNPEIEALYKEAEEKAKEEEAAVAAAKLDSKAAEAAEAAEEATLVEETVTVEETPAVEETVTVEEAPKVDEVFVEEPIEIEVPEIIKEEKTELESMVDEFIDNHAVAHEEKTNSYISDMIDEVSKYNEANGDMTISQIASNMVHEVRHPGEEIVQETPVVQKAVEEEKTAEELKKEDDEFSNTVSMEIAKIMDEIDTMELRQEPAAPVITEEPIAETVQPEPVKEVIVPTPVKEEPVRPEPVKAEPVKEKPVVEEHPVLAKALEDEYAEEVVEIKNLTELEAEPVKDTVSNTIPFVVATSDDEEEIEDDDEESSNTILNIILIVLIIVLVAVLGLIVFYILKTKGII